MATRLTESASSKADALLCRDVYKTTAQFWRSVAGAGGERMARCWISKAPCAFDGTRRDDGAG